MHNRHSLTHPLVVAALAITWLVWGSSFLAIHVALTSFPPLLLMASRFIVAGGILTGAGMLRAHRAGRALPGAAAWRDAAVVGLGAIALSMGTTSWAGTRLSSGVNGLLVVTAPLWIVVLQLIRSRGRSANTLALSGVAVGVGAVVVLAAPSSGRSIDMVAVAAVALGNLAWAGASLYAQGRARGCGIATAVGMQMLTGGAMLVAASAASGEFTRFSVTALTPAAIGGWLFLVLVASLGGFVAYGWLLEHVNARVASTYAFVNPLVAVALGAAVLGETLNARVVAASLGILAAVTMLLMAERTPKPNAIRIRRRTRRAMPPAFAAARRTPRPARFDKLDTL